MSSDPWRLSSPSFNASMLRIPLLLLASLLSSSAWLNHRPLTRSTTHLLDKLVTDTARAGEDGYSVLRQPISRSNWDPSADPDFELPSTLQDKPLQQQDADWWQQRESSKAIASRRPSPTPASEPADDAELDLFQRSLDTLDYPRVLKALREECTTAPARSLVEQARQSSPPKRKHRIPRDRERAYQPLTAETVEGAQERYRAVEEMTWILQGGHGNVRLDDVRYRHAAGYQAELAGRPPPFSGQDFNVESILAEVDQGRVLESADILAIANMLSAMQSVQNWGNALRRVDELDFVELPKLVDCISVNETLQDLLENAFDKEGRLSGSTFPVLGRLRARVRSFRADIMAKLDGLLALPSIQAKLALESGGALYSEVSGGRLVIPVASKYASSIGIVHDTSRSGKTVYVEPTEIVSPTNELRQAEGELRGEEARMWRLLTEQIVANRVDLEASASAIGQLDLVMARIQLGRKLSGVVPVVEDKGVISLRDARHPVLLLREIADVVGSDVDLGDTNQGLVLTGPNSGGKTVILKLLGLMAIMSRSGIPVPAKGPILDKHDPDQVLHRPRVDFFNPVLADIGDLQSVGGDLSTFSGHMLVCREVLANSGQNALVLMDEVGSGTDPNQGVALAQALLEALLETGARVAITTHFMQLKQLAAADDRFAVAGMQFIGGRPTYKLLPGTVGESFALAVAERLELPRKVIDRATELLDSETRQMGDLIRELEDQKALVDQQVLEMEEKKKEMARMEMKLKEEQLRLEKKQLVARREEAKKFARMLEEKEQILEDILEKLKLDPSRRVLAKSWDDIRFVKRDALNEAENIPSVLAKKQQAAAAMEDFEAELVPIAEMRDKPELQPGDELIVCKQGPLFGRQASVVKALSGRVEVKVNNMNVSLKLSQVALPVKGARLPQLYQNNNHHRQGPKSTSKAAERAIAEEQREFRGRQGDTTADEPKSAGVTMRTDSNTVDVRGCNLEEAKEKAKTKFSAALLTGRSVVYILHGHGTGGVLKNKIRQWLKSERQLVQSFGPADQADGGDAFTRVQLR